MAARQIRRTRLTSKASPGTLLFWIHHAALLHSSDGCLIWPFAVDEAGYGKAFIDGKSKQAHRVVCELAHGLPPTPKHVAAHSCGNGHKGCVAKNHLRWATMTENHADRDRHGRTARGELHGKSKLTADQVREIRNLLADGKTITMIGPLFNVTPGTIHAIKTGLVWRWLQ